MSKKSKRERQPRQERPRPRRTDLWIAAGLTLLAWVHRLIFLRSNRDFAWPYTFFYEGDSEVFFLYARAILEGKLYDEGVPFHPPGFAWFLGFLHAFLGAGEVGAKVPHVAVKSIMALLGSVAIGLLFLLVRPYLGRTAALIAALLGVYHFGLYVLSIAPVTESLYLVLLLLILLIWTRRFQHPLSADVGAGLAPAREGVNPSPTPFTSVGLGLLLGALALTRAEGALVAVLLVGIGLLGANKKSWALVVLGGVLVVAPWTIRNAVRMQAINEKYETNLPTFVPLTLYGPINLALANNPMAEGSFSREWMSSQAQNPGLDLRDPQHVEFLVHGDRMAFDWARENPGDFLVLVGKKWKLVSEAFTLGWTQWNVPGGLNGKRRPVDVFVPNSKVGYWIVVPLVLLGLVLCLRKPGAPRRWVGVVMLLTVSLLVATGLFFGYVRLGLLFLPFWLTFIAAALSWKLPSDPPRRLWQALAGIVAVLLVLEIWGISLHRNFKATGVNVPGRSYLDRDSPIYLELLP
ncbi:MAG TPA: glycosyltransferase family 39 protein [Thermoanaerobaculia bacterium]|nr:glycosyltransferase family 39 protein [Thermoanaerobaculia bacterium]